MPEKIAYDLIEAAKAYPASINVLRRAVRTTDPNSFPPPLRSKRLGKGPNAKYVILAEDLREWHDLLPDA